MFASGTHHYRGAREPGPIQENGSQEENRRLVSSVSRVFYQHHHAKIDFVAARHPLVFVFPKYTLRVETPFELSPITSQRRARLSGGVAPARAMLVGANDFRT